MATKKAATTTVAKKGTTAVISWQDELAKQAEEAAKMEQNTGGGQFFSLKNGILKWQDNPLPDNQMAVIIIDGIMENAYYTGDYDPATPQPPTCFAFGRSEEEMVPHDVVFKNGTQQSDKCSSCQWNEWGSAEKGRGKACKNGRRLALLGIGTFDKSGAFSLHEELDIENSQVGYMRIPVTSIKGYAGYVKQLNAVLHRPPHGIITKVRVVSDEKDQFKVNFEAIQPVPDEMMQAVMTKHNVTRQLIEFPYQPANSEEGETKNGKTVKPAAKRKY